MDPLEPEVDCEVVELEDDEVDADCWLEEDEVVVGVVEMVG